MTEFLLNNFHHYDIQSITTDITNTNYKNYLGNDRKNQSTGASAASNTSDYGDFVENELLRSCPNFRNEIPSLLRQQDFNKIHILEDENEDFLGNEFLGGNFYRRFFYEKDHENWISNDENFGPMAISIVKEKSSFYFYRIILRFASLPTLRGCIAEDVIVTTKKNSDKIYSKEIIECLFPLVAREMLRLATNSAPKILLKLDEQGLTWKHKIGVLYCGVNQCSEEDFYNNENGSDAFEEFLGFLGKRINLEGFGGYSGGLDCRDNTTGKTSIHTKFHSYEIMFHVSTLLPLTTTNRQQLMRKRHIGNDIVTIVFQDKGALPFSPASIRSQFQHVFIIVRAISRNKFTVAISRSQDVPYFGPPLSHPHFSLNSNFHNFLMAKCINGENATYRSEKFTAMATRTRNEYLKDLYLNHTFDVGLETFRSRFSMLSLIRKSRPSPSIINTLNHTPPGAIAYKIGENNEFVAMSSIYIAVIRFQDVSVVKISDVVAWTCRFDRNLLSLHYYKNGMVTMTTEGLPVQVMAAMVSKLKVYNSVAVETETLEMTRSNNNLGFHIQHDGLVTHVQKGSSAAMATLSVYSRVLFINSHEVSRLSHEEMIRILKTDSKITLIVIPGRRNF